MSKTNIAIKIENMTKTLQDTVIESTKTDEGKNA